MPLLDHRPYKQTTIYHFGTTTIVIYIFVVQQIQFKRGRKKIEKGTKTKRFGPKKKKNYIYTLLGRERHHEITGCARWFGASEVWD